MTTVQKVIKYLSIALAVFLIVSIFSGLIGVVGMLSTGGSWFGDGLLDKSKEYQISGDITDMEIEVSVAKLTIVEAEEFRVASNLKHLTVKEEGGCLVIDEKKSTWRNVSNKAEITVYIPEGYEFDEVDMELGVGETTVESLSVTGNMELTGGVGEIAIRDSALHNLDVDMGVGELNLTGKVTGDCQLGCGVGSVKLNLDGEKEDYRFRVSKGLGEVIIDGEKMEDNAVCGDGENHVGVEGGVGDIQISFRPKTV